MDSEKSGFDSDSEFVMGGFFFSNATYVFKSWIANIYNKLFLNIVK